METVDMRPSGMVLNIEKGDRGTGSSSRGVQVP